MTIHTMRYIVSLMIICGSHAMKRNKLIVAARHVLTCIVALPRSYNLLDFSITSIWRALAIAGGSLRSESLRTLSGRDPTQ
ncbi:MAG: hypothetical protein QXK88_08935 [Desulfurococcaceae archaeon]